MHGEGDGMSDDLDELRDEEGMREAEAYHEAELERKGRRHPGYFCGWPSDEQMEYFKRGGR